ncbi:MAG: NHL repeat-containing protein, partial [Verrucomicrobiota bacterium]
AFNSAGDLFVADIGNNSIYEFTTNGVQSTFASGLNSPAGLAFNNAGYLFEADSINGYGAINAFTPGGARSTFASDNLNAPLNAPAGMAFNSAGDLFVADASSSKIYEYTPGGVQSTFASGLSSPQGLAFNNSGNLFVADSGSGNIYEFTTNGVQSTFASGMSSPEGLAFNSAGVLFVANAGSGTIIEIATNGMQSPFAAGLNFPSFIAFQPVMGPPPSLNIATTGNQSVLFWPASGNNYILQSTTNLASTNWVTATDAVPVTAFTVTNSSPARYFRLAQP